jgi:hypothetical protein
VKEKQYKQQVNVAWQVRIVSCGPVPVLPSSWPLELTNRLNLHPDIRMRGVIPPPPLAKVFMAYYLITAGTNYRENWLRWRCLRPVLGRCPVRISARTTHWGVSWFSSSAKRGAYLQCTSFPNHYSLTIVPFCAIQPEPIGKHYTMKVYGEMDVQI